MAPLTVTDLEVVEDLTTSARCDEGFLQVRRLRVRNRRSDGSTSPVYRVDVVDRPRLDAVAVLVYLRPAAYFRKDKSPVVRDAVNHLFCEEIIAGLLEPGDVGAEGLRARGASEVLEEAGFTVAPDALELLGQPFLVAPGIISEKIFLAAVDVTGLEHGLPAGDGSPLEEGGTLRWRSATDLSAAIESGEVQDAKTEIALSRLLARRRKPR
jgi:ADP-ribose pyrophosphatase